MFFHTAQKALYFDYCFPVIPCLKQSVYGAYFCIPGTLLLIFVVWFCRNTLGWELNLILAETSVVKSF